MSTGKENGVVYLLTCLVSGKQYVGQTWDYEKRMGKYRRGHCKDQRAIYNAIAKYGWNNFTAVKIVQGIQTKDLLGKIETAYIKAFNTISPHGYNLTTGGDGGKPCAETKAKLRALNLGKMLSPEHRNKISASLQGNKNRKGKPMSPETRKKISAKMSASMRGNKNGKGKPHTAETKAKMRASHLGKTLSPETRKKISESKRGKKNSMFGKSPWNKGKRGVQVPWNKGKCGVQIYKPRSPETRAKMSASAKARWARERTAVKTATASLL